MRPASWNEAFAAIAAKVTRANAKRIGAIVGDLAAVEEMFALKDLMTRLGVANLDCRQDGAVLDPKCGPGELSLQCDHRRHRAGRRAADRRHQSAPRGGGAQCPHPQALARRRGLRDRPHRRAGRAHLSPTTISAPAPRRWPISPRHSFADTLRKAERPLVIVGAGVLARPDGAAIASLAAKAAIDSAPSRKAGTAIACCTPRRRGSARSTSASCPARAA